MNKGRCDGGGCLHHLVAYQIYWFARAINTRGQHLGSTYRNLHLGDNLALLVFNLEDTALVTFHYLIHAVGDGTHCYSILNDECLHRAYKQVGLAGNPLLAALGLDALRQFQIVIILPRSGIRGSYPYIIGSFFIFMKDLTGCFTNTFRGRHHTFIIFSTSFYRSGK